MTTEDGMQFEDQLAAAMRTSVETLTPPVADLVSGGLTRGRQRRRRNQIGAALVAGAVAVAGAGAVVLTQQRGDDASTVATAGAGCHSLISTGVLPSWARAGFSDPEPAMPHVLSAKGDITAILFGTPLNAPPAADHNNKILWAPRVGAYGSLVIDAVREGTTTHVRREVAGGPGPSIIDLPQPGCWHLTLRWGTHRDTIDLEYARP